MSRRGGRRFADKDMRKKNAKGASVPIPKFASIRRDRWANFGIDKDTSKSILVVPLLN